MSSEIDYNNRIYSARTELHMSRKIECVSHSIRHPQKRTFQKRLPQVSHFIRHAQKNAHVGEIINKLVLCSARTDTHTSSEINYNNRTLLGTHRIAYVKQDRLKSRTLFGTYKKRACRWNCLQTLTLFGTHKTRMVSKADVRSRTLFGTQKTHMSSKIASSFAHIQHAQKMYMSSNIALSPALYSARSENALVKVDWLTDLIKTDLKSTNLAWSEISHVKWKWLRKSLTLINTHVLSKIDFKSRTLFGTLRNLTCRVGMTSRTLFSALRKRTRQLRLTTSLILYSARTENAHVKKNCLKPRTLLGTHRKCTC